MKSEEKPIPERMAQLMTDVEPDNVVPISKAFQRPGAAERIHYFNPMSALTLRGALAG